MSLHKALALLILILSICFTTKAWAAPPATNNLYSCLNILGLTGGVGQSCVFNSECPGQLVCHEHRCAPPAKVAEERRSKVQEQEDFLSHAPTTDDGGADAACGTDRRCRIQRLASQNRQRRHLHIAKEEIRTQTQINHLLQRKQESINRLNRPWAAAFQIHPMGYGLLASRSINAHLHAEISAVLNDTSIYFTPDDPQLPRLEGYQDGFFTLAHLTYLPSKGWFSPLFSAGVGMGRGKFHSYNAYSGDSSIAPTTIYHLVTAAIGADAQFKSGFLLRLAFRHGRILYNQARYSPGVYDLGLKGSLRDYMNTQGLWGVDFSIGWAF